MKFTLPQKMILTILNIINISSVFYLFINITNALVSDFTSIKIWTLLTINIVLCLVVYKIFLILTRKNVSLIWIFLAWFLIVLMFAIESFIPTEFLMFAIEIFIVNEFFIMFFLFSYVFILLSFSKWIREIDLENSNYKLKKNRITSIFVWLDKYPLIIASVIMFLYFLLVIYLTTSQGAVS